MSTFELSSWISESADETFGLGLSLAHSLYRRPLDILLSGELGAGKTRFTQGFAKGLGVADRIVSPTFALEQRYGQDLLLHLDLYRLNEAQSLEVLEASDDFPGFRLIEWPRDSLPAEAGRSIHVSIQETGLTSRKLHFSLNDFPLPSEDAISGWIRETAIPAHIIRHMEAVEAMASECADLIAGQGIFIRKQAVKCAARIHDLLRFVDFKPGFVSKSYTPAEAELKLWSSLKTRYGAGHEAAARLFLIERGYEDLGSIIATHGLTDNAGSGPPHTIEQKILAYADKRVLFDRIVSVDERFDDFVIRYGDGKESPRIAAWRRSIKKLEKELFPDAKPGGASL